MMLYWQIAAGVFEWSFGWKIALIVINAVALTALLAVIIGSWAAHRRAFRNAEIMVIGTEESEEQDKALIAEEGAASAEPANESGIFVGVTEGEGSFAAGETEEEEQGAAALPVEEEIFSEEQAVSEELLPPFSSPEQLEQSEQPVQSGAEDSSSVAAAEEPQEECGTAETAEEPQEECAAAAAEMPPETFAREDGEPTGEEGYRAAGSEGAAAGLAAASLSEADEAAMADYRSGKRRNLSFEDKLAAADEEMRSMYSSLREDLLAYEGVKVRASHGCDTFKYQKRKVVAKFVMAGKRLVVYLALDPSAYPDPKFPVEDKRGVSLYADTPMGVKVRGASTFKFVRRLIADMAENEGMRRTAPPAEGQ